MCEIEQPVGRFADRVAVVTGATRGIGRAITLALLQQDAQVVGTYGGDKASADALKETWAKRGNPDALQLHCCDVSDAQAVEGFYQQLAEDVGRLDILVNNAGVRRDHMLALMPDEDWQRVIDVNLTGGYRMAKFALPLMRRQRYGRVIFMTSPMGHLGFAGQANYAASKAGQVGMMKSLAKETAKRKITVNCVSPGFIDTDFIGDLPPEQVQAYKKLIPARRFGTPEEVAEAVLFLASPEAAYITGSVLEITGGL